MKTSLSREAYGALAAAVGKANINEDDSAVASHAWNALGGDLGPNQLSLAWPSAIVLPGSTAEVQAVLKLCSRYGIRSRAVSTGVFSTAGKVGEHYVIIDLRRMKGLKIDAKNQVAEIEPYATAGQIQAEAMKHGLTCHIVGAGPPHSPLASATAMQGIGIAGATTGVNFRNLLSFEWVTPEGEILRVGSAGCGAGWFSGEGPGPGFRGMIRGDTGTMGGLGIFTKIGLKLHPWRATAPVESTGAFPQLGMKIPEHCKLYHLAWDSWEDASEAAIQFNLSGVADYWVRIPPHDLGGILTATNNEFVAHAQAGNLPEAARNENGKAWTVLTVALSEAEARYKAKVMQKIMADTAGRDIPIAPEHAEILARNLVTSAYVIRAFRPALGGISSFGVLDSFRLLPKVMNTAEEMMADDIAAGRYASAGPDGVWSWPNEGRYLWAENVPTHDANDKRTAAATIRYYLRLAERLLKNPIGVNGFVTGPASDLVGPRLGFANVWMRRVKNQFDPKNLSMANHYISPDQTVEGKVWPIARRILLGRWGAPLFKFITDRMATKNRN